MTDEDREYLALLTIMDLVRTELRQNNLLDCVTLSTLIRTEKNNPDFDGVAHLYVLANRSKMKDLHVSWNVEKISVPVAIDYMTRVLNGQLTEEVVRKDLKFNDKHDDRDDSHD